MKRIICFMLALACLCGCAPGRGESPSECAEKPAIYLYPEGKEEPVDEKPVIYLNPEEATEVTVKLDFDGILTCTYPDYRDGWTVRAWPDGTLMDDTGRTYSYLFWEGVSGTEYDMSRGFVVPGADTKDFLEEKLAALGLNDREAGDFITYWLPRMQKNPYNLVTFQQEAYTESARLEITPEPDSLLRVFMVFQPLAEPVEVEAPELPGFTRAGFTVVEWGGMELK